MLVESATLAYVATKRGVTATVPPT